MQGPEDIREWSQDERNAYFAAFRNEANRDYICYCGGYSADAGKDVVARVLQCEYGRRPFLIRCENGEDPFEMARVFNEKRQPRPE